MKAGARAAAAQPYLPVPEDAPVVQTFLVRFGIRVAALAIVAGALKLVTWLSEGGAKWPQAILIVLGIVGILAAPFVLYVRLRRLARILFAPKNDR